jgi:hypothetical protein
MGRIGNPSCAAAIACWGELVYLLYEVSFFLLPLGIYCLVLAGINRRSSPLLVSGVWDTLGLLFAASGFLLASVPMFLNELYLRTLDELPAEPIADTYFRHSLIWVAYYTLLLIGSAVLLWRRRHTTMIYNVDSEVLHHQLDSTLASLGLGIRERQHRIVIVPAPPLQHETAIAEGEPIQAPVVAQDKRYAEIRIDSFPMFCHVTLHWDQCQDYLRQDIEKELEKGLEHATPEDNPVAGWLYSASGLIFGIISMVLLTFIFLIFFPR